MGGCVLVGVPASEDVDLVLADLQGEGVLEQLHLLKDVPRGGAHEGPLVSGRVVELDDLVDVVELVESAQLEHVSAAQRADRRLPHCHVALRELGPLLLPQRVPVVLLRALLPLAPPAHQVHAPIHVEQCCVPAPRRQRTPVAGLALADLVEVGVNLVFVGAAVDRVDLARRGDDAPGLGGEGPVVGELPLVVVVLAEGVDLAGIGHRIVRHLFGVGNAVVQDGLGLVESFLEVGGTADDWSFGEGERDGLDLEGSDLVVRPGCLSDVELVVLGADCGEDCGGEADLGVDAFLKEVRLRDVYFGSALLLRLLLIQQHFRGQHCGPDVGLVDDELEVGDVLVGLGFVADVLLLAARVVLELHQLPQHQLQVVQLLLELLRLPLSLPQLQQVFKPVDALLEEHHVELLLQSLSQPADRLLVQLAALDCPAEEDDVVDEYSEVVLGVAELAVRIQARQRLRQQQLFLLRELHVLFEAKRKIIIYFHQTTATIG